VGGHDNLINSLEAIMAARREELGEAPTPEELLAYRDGRLPPKQRRTIEAKIAVYPDAARALADLRAFPAVAPAPGTSELSDAEIGARWQTFRKRLAEPPPPTRPQVADPAALAQISAPPRPPLHGWRSAPRLAAAALAALALGWAAGFMAGRGSRHRSDSAVNVQIAELAPAGEGGLRSAASAVEMPAGAEELVLILGAPAPQERVFPDYEAEVVDAAGVRVWSRQGLRPTSLGTFHLSFRRGALAPGRYRIHLFGRAGPGRMLVTTYDLRLLGGAQAR
jgi:anti-sigma factor RsiW